MKKWKIVLSAILVGVAAVACGTAIGCKKHSHEYASEWSANSVAHWHEPTCGDTDGKGSYGEHTFNGDYHCTTCEYDLELGGLSITKTTTDYELKNRLTRSIPTNDIKVTAIAADQLSEIELDASQYSLEYYKDDTKIDNLSSVGGGAYNIWATATIGGEELDSFVMVYVKETVTDFKLNAGYTDTQEIGIDTMSDTWNFTVTYSSTRKETIGVNDPRITLDNYSTFVAAEGKEALVTFSETDCKGETVSKNLGVSYTVTNTGNNDIQFFKYSYDAIQNTLANPNDDNQVLNSSNFVAVENVGDNSFLTLLEGGTAQYRKNDKVSCLEVKGDILNVTFEGVGMLVIKCRSTGDSNTSSIALKIQEGEYTNYIAASYNNDAQSPTVAKDDDENIYSVTGAGNTLTFVIDKPGTYTICTVIEVLTGGDFVDTNRYTRIEGLEMTDIRTNQAAEVE